ncbi:MAG: S41 family peptidase [Saprospiraceae bacterium]
MKNQRIIIAFIAIFTIILSSCQTTFLGEDEPNTQKNNFEIFWNDFDQHYGLFVARGWNWDSIYQVYQPQVTAQTTDDELWTIFSKMIGYLDDSHTFIYDPSKELFYVSGDSLGTIAEEQFSLSLIRSKYIDHMIFYHDENNDEDIAGYAKVVDKNIGYIYLEGIENNAAIITDVVDNLKNYEAIILDLRLNGGGFDEAAALIAGAFADEERLAYTVQTRNGENHDDFDEIKEFTTTKNGDFQYTKPVIVLTDAYTVSAAEVLLLHLRNFPHVTFIGDFTSGDFSDGSMLRFLPNGWLYRYSPQMFLTPEGKSLDGIGHEPDILITNTKANIDAENDLVFERAIQYLFEEYGID